MNPTRIERVLDKFIDRTFTFDLRTGEFCNKYAVAEVYFIIRNTLDKISYKQHVKKFLKKYR